MKKTAALVLTSAIITLAAVSPLFRLRTAVAQGSNLPIPETPVAVPDDVLVADELIPTDIAVLEEDRQRFSSFTGVVGQVVSIDNVETLAVDALLVSVGTLNSAKLDETLRQKLQRVVSSDTILVVPDVRSAEIKEIFEVENMPTAEVDEPILFSTVMDLKTGKTVAGLVLGSPEAGPTPDLPTVLQTNIAYLKELKTKEYSDRGIESPEPDIYTKQFVQGSDLTSESFSRSQQVYIDVYACPYGRVPDSSTAEQILGDGNYYKDYFDIKHEQFTNSGARYCNNSTYQIDSLYSNSSVYNGYNSIIDYGPTTTNNESSATVTLNSELAFEASWTFSLPAVSIRDQSNPFALAAWFIDYRLNSSPARYTYQSEPGIRVKTPQGTDLTVYREFILSAINNSFNSDGVAKAYRFNFKNYN